MANPEHLALLKQGVEVWNAWRRKNPTVRPDLNGADLAGMSLRGAILMWTDLVEANLAKAELGDASLSESNLSKANLTDAGLGEAEMIRSQLVGAKLDWAYLNAANLEEANLTDASLHEAQMSKANLEKANLQRADLNGATLIRANLDKANLRGANLMSSRLVNASLGGADLTGAYVSRAYLTGAYLSEANLSWATIYRAIFCKANLSQVNFTAANLQEADLTEAHLVGANFENANLIGCSIFGISAWSVNTVGAKQSDLIITRPTEPTITVDNLEVAQFIYLLLNNEKIRGVIDTVARKLVLILGRFTPERKAVLDGIREELRERDYLPVLFDFDKPATRDITETMRTLAHLSRFIIADITDPSSIPLELQAVVPDLAVPVQPLLLTGQREFSMFVDLRKKYHWVLATYQYTDINDLLAALAGKVIAPAEQKAKELEKR